MKKFFFTLFFVSAFHFSLIAQENQPDKGNYVEYKNTFFQMVLDSSEAFYKAKDGDKKEFKVDFTNYNLPKSKDEFKYYWHNDPKNYPQGNSGMCWDFCATSYYESEIYRMRGEKIKLSELFTTYWEYVEKARRFVKEHGNSFFGQGSESNAIPRIWKKHGIVPHEVYTGLKENQTFHYHERLFNEMKKYLEYIKENNAWNEEAAINTVKSILNYHLGEPPAKFNYKGKDYTPETFLKNVVKINFDDYIDFQSTLKQQYYTKGEFDVPDNWWHSKDYYNIPIDEFMQIVKKSIREGYTICIGGDVSEAGVYPPLDAAVIPSFDIPSEYIDEYAREYRISNGSTQDDHGIHLVGYLEKDGKDWYLIKDSGSGSRNGNAYGYYFYHEDFVKLKMLSFSVHKDMVKEILGKMG